MPVLTEHQLDQDELGIKKYFGNDFVVHTQGEKNNKSQYDKYVMTYTGGNSRNYINYSRSIDFQEEIQGDCICGIDELMLLNILLHRYEAQCSVCPSDELLGMISSINQVLNAHKKMIMDNLK